jgi:hypothetical protein
MTVKKDDLVALFQAGEKTPFNLELVNLFEELGRDLTATVTCVNDWGIKLTRKQVSGKLSICGVKNIVPKTPTKPKKDTGPTKKELIAQLAEKVGLNPADLLTFNNVKKSELSLLINAISE